jgi:site-specific recombinase XerD
VIDFPTLITEHIHFLELQDKAPKTLTARKSKIKCFSDWYNDNKETLPGNIKKITARDINRYMHHRKIERKLESSTRKQDYLALKMFFAWLKAEGYIKKNPMKKVSPVPVKKKLAHFTNKSSIETLIGICERDTFYGTRDRLIFSLLHETGIRADELLHIKLEEINEGDQTILVHGKGNKDRLVPYGDLTAIALIQYLPYRNKHPHRYSPYLLISNQSNRLTYGGLRGVFEKRCAEADLNHMHPHELRHAFAHEWKKEGRSPEGLKEILGHSSLATQEIYGAALAAERALEEYRKRQRKEE